jgi:subtilisin family serine protease
MKIADKHNAMIVTAAGNENMLAGIDPMHRPKNFIVVSATDKANNAILKAPFSNYGDYTTVSAPGTNIYSSVGRGDYTFMSGTSMAAPIVSGAVALMKSINSTLTAHQIICILQQTGLPLNGNIGPLLQLDKALQMVKSGTYGDCDSRPAVPTSGDVQVLLSWNNYNDLDLACMDPNGEVVWFKNRRVTSGGRLEIDMNVDPNDSPAPIENIYWPQDGAPLGNYEVFIWLYKQHEITAASSHYKLNLLYGGKKEVIEGDITAANGRVSVARFTLGTETNSGIRGRMNSQPDTQLHEQLRRRRNELLQELDTINKKLNIN